MGGVEPLFLMLERKTRIELATPSLEDWCSTVELFPLVVVVREFVFDGSLHNGFHIYPSPVGVLPTHKVGLPSESPQLSSLPERGQNQGPRCRAPHNPSKGVSVSGL